MPASLFSDMDRGSKSLEDQRALELAFNLQTMSMLLNNDNECVSNFELEPRSKKSQNTTECVPVPSSEHVAEIVGRQGCKIKALRAKTNTYIKTPVRGEEPVFVVTGRREDVCSAKREILSAAEHFSQIRAQRRGSLGACPGPNAAPLPGQTTAQVRVPYRVVGLVVGPKGATIKRIQQATGTYIVTPSRDREPVFEVTGLPDSVEAARREIEAHIAMRTGGSVDDGDLDCVANNLNALQLCPPASFDSDKRDIFGGGDIFGGRFGYFGDGSGDDASPTFAGGPASTWPDFAAASSQLTDSGVSSLFGSGSSSSSNGLGDLSQRSNSISGALADFILGGSGDHPPARRIHSDPESLFSFSPGGFPCGGGSSSSSVESLSRPSPKRDCISCFESAIVAALVPCGHNFFCMECASRICNDAAGGECPVCHQPVVQAMRIYN